MSGKIFVVGLNQLPEESLRVVKGSLGCFLKPLDQEVVADISELALSMD